MKTGPRTRASLRPGDSVTPPAPDALEARKLAQKGNGTEPGVPPDSSSADSPDSDRSALQAWLARRPAVPAIVALAGFSDEVLDDIADGGLILRASSP